MKAGQLGSPSVKNELYSRKLPAENKEVFIY